MDVETIITMVGYILFGLSEFVALLPIQSNGFFDGAFKMISSFLTKQKNKDIEHGLQELPLRKEDNNNSQRQVNTPNLDPEISNALKVLLNTSQIAPHISSLAPVHVTPQMQYINTLLQAHPEIIRNATKAIESILIDNVIEQK